MINLSAIIVAEQYLPDFITCYAGLDGTVRNVLYVHVLAEYLVGSLFFYRSNIHILKMSVIQISKLILV